MVDGKEEVTPDYQFTSDAAGFGGSSVLVPEFLQVKLINIFCYFLRTCDSQVMPGFLTLRAEDGDSLASPGGGWHCVGDAVRTDPFGLLGLANILAMFGCWLAVQLRSSGERQCPFSRTVCTANNR